MDNPIHQNDSRTPESVHVAIMGAGITGLRILWALCSKKQRGPTFHITLIDKNEEPGGLLKSEKQNGFILEWAAQGVLMQRSSWQQLVQHAQLSLIPSGPLARSRYLISRTALLRLSPWIWTWVLKGFLTPWQLVRAFCEPFVAKKVQPDPNETLFDFISRRFGVGFARFLAVPLCTGIWGGAARSLLLRYTFPQLLEWEQTHGSVTQGVLAKIRKSLQKLTPFAHPEPKRVLSADEKIPLKGLTSGPTGMQGLAAELFRTCLLKAKENGHVIHEKWGSHVESLKAVPPETSGQGVGRPYVSRWVLLNSQGQAVTSPCSSVFLCMAPWQNAGLRVCPENTAQGTFQASWMERWPKICTLPTHDFVVVFLACDKKYCGQISGFGALAGDDSPDLLGVLFVHDIFPEHVPPQQALFRVLLGGDRLPQAPQLSSEELIDRAKQALMRYAFVSMDTSFTLERVMKQPKAVPLGTAEMDDFLKNLWQLEVDYGGLFFAGNYTHGAGVADCLVSAEKALERAKLDV